MDLTVKERAKQMQTLNISAASLREGDLLDDWGVPGEIVLDIFETHVQMHVTTDMTTYYVDPAHKFLVHRA